MKRRWPLRVGAGLLLLVLLLAGGCDDDVTQVLVTVRAGTAEQAGAWGSVRLFVDRDVGEDSMPVYDLSTTSKLPLQVGVLPRGASMVTLRAEAYASNDGSGDMIASSEAHSEMFKDGHVAKVTLVLGEDDVLDGGATDGDTGDGGPCEGPGCGRGQAYLPEAQWPLLCASGTKDVTVAASEVAIFYSDNGQVTGAITRPPTAGPPSEENGGIGFVRIAQPGGPDVGVFYVKSLTVAEGGALRVQGNSAFALLASGDIVINDDMEASAQFAEGGAGGIDGYDAFKAEGAPAYVPMNGNVPRAPVGMAEPTAFGGGGGGSNGGLGGVGGAGYLLNTNTSFPGGAPGQLATTGLFVGGGGGGAGVSYNFNTSMARSGAGGGGGGAMLLVSGTAVQIGFNGNLRASGGGAVVVDSDDGALGAGAGGGAGGTIVIEAPSITVQGTIAANGGAGGGGDASQEVAQSSSPGGRPDSTPAAGTTGVSAPGHTAGTGGNGAAAADAAGKPGGDGLNTADTVGFGAPGGGGGGGPGRILLRTAAGNASVTGATFSPSVSSGITIIDDRLTITCTP